MNKKSLYILMALAALAQQAQAQRDSVTSQLRGQNIQDETVDIGADRTFKLSESTASVSVIQNKDINRRSAINASNSILGQGLGLVSLQNTSSYNTLANPTFYVRGLQSLSGSSPLILVDGVERSMNMLAPEEVESVSILKDAAAVALYGYKGVNGAILVTTKRGKVKDKTITISYDHAMNFLANKPKFADAYTYANAINEARANDGLSARYNENELAAFKNGNLPEYYPNTDWVGETFRDYSVTNKLTGELQGGSQKFRYYTMVNLLYNNGFIKEPNTNDGYSTNQKYVKGNLRINLDADITPTTLMKVNLLGYLSEQNLPGANVDLWNMIYTLPSAAFPAVTGEDTYGGNSTWSGTINPVGQSRGAGYYKNHNRGYFTDLTLRQDLSALTKGLYVQGHISYDNINNIYEDHSKTYIYTSKTLDLTKWDGGEVEDAMVNTFSGGSVSELGTGANTNSYSRRLNIDFSADYQRQFGDHSLYGQFKYSYEYFDQTGINETLYRQNFSLFGHYGYLNRYFAELALVESGSSRLAPGSKWSFSPTLSAAWVISKEKFMENADWVDFLKLRLSAGKINADLLPSDTWTYYLQQYGQSGGTYPFSSGWTSDFGRTYLDRMATQRLSHEKAYKYNVGIDATLFHRLNITAEAYLQRRSDIWVETDGKYTSMLGIDAPYEADGKVKTWGYELGLDYNDQFGQVKFNVGGNASLNRSKILEQDEEPRLYDNLVQTGNRLSQLYGYKAIGFFKDEEDIANSPTQTFSTVKPGDIKYEDVNGDNKIDANDMVKIGYSTVCPELYFNLHLGVEYKGFGIYALFQGTGRYSAMLNTQSMFAPLVGNTTISEYYYNNRWTEETAETAKFPRLSSESNSNNYRNNTVFLCNRSYFKLRNLEVYYNFPAKLFAQSKSIHGAKVYVRGVDLFSIDHFDVLDPEAYGASSPLTRNISAGFSVTF
ncbi:MAG: SusC/RagA family TonB-linked outer membrane protein [Prevotella sp.]|jgi:TonB-linked SusC/RagA family outer membrane protein